VVEIDHKNLTHWKSPKKLMGHMVRWYEKIQDYNFQILHIPRKTNTPADVLSRPGEDEHEVEEKQISLIPLEAFLNLLNGEDPDHITQQIWRAQYSYPQWLKRN
jgi:hypothetical protein